MNEYIIPIHGLIGFPESKSDKKVYFTYNDFLTHISNSKNADQITLDIASDGGYCDIADKMISLLISQNKPIAAYNSGNVASAASKIFTTANKEMRVFYPQKGLFLIHNPWSQTEGDANDHLQSALELAKIEDQYVNWYSDKTGTESGIISEIMSENIPLTISQIESLGFATVVIPTVQAFAKIKSNINMENNNEEVLSKVSKLEKLMQSFFKSNGKSNTVSMMIADVAGNELVIDEINDMSELSIGNKVTISGASASDGEYILSDGSKIVIVGGLVSEIIPSTETGTETEITIETTSAVMTEEEQKVQDDMMVEMETLKADKDALVAENQALKDELQSLKDTSQTTVAQIEELSVELKSIKALASGFKSTVNTPSNNADSIKPAKSGISGFKVGKYNK